MAQAIRLRVDSSRCMYIDEAIGAVSQRECGSNRQQIIETASDSRLFDGNN